MKTTNTLTIVIVILIGLLTMTYLKLQNTKADRNVAISNCKAYEDRLSSSMSTIRAFQFTEDQLRHSNDSIVLELKKVQEELHIKDKNIQRLEHISSEFSTMDTIYTVDTIFVRDVTIDTTIGDEWMNNHLTLRYPNMVSIESVARSSKNVIVHSSRETINPPKKFFLFRWFQKKHTVIKIDVVESNPHITSEDNVFIEVLR